jgi:hypothetical protein
MKRIFVVVAIAVTVLATNVVSVGAAGQGKPVFEERFSFDDPAELDVELSSECGIQILVSGSGKVAIKEYADGSSVVHFRTNNEFYSPDTGETLLRRDAATLRGFSEEVFNPEDEILTIMFDDTFVGLPAQWSKRGEGVLLRDAGSVRFQGTVVLDFSGGEEPIELFFEEMQTVRGPHPELDTDVLGFICEQLGA